jgi:glycosyltransferase involved in cell wall biosynthesis
MNIWLVQIAEPLPIGVDVRKLRTSLLADNLTEKGHSVLWWTSAFDHSRKKWIFRTDMELNVKSNFKIKALKGVGYKKNISFSRFVDHRIIARKFRRSAPEMPKPDIIITSMPPHNLAFEVVMFAKDSNIPVLVDVRDEWPDLFLDHIPAKLKRFFKIVLFREFSMIKKAMQNADGLISMMSPLLEWGLDYAKRDKTWIDKVFYLGYKKNVCLKNRSSKIVKLMEGFENKFIVTFIGAFVHYNDPSILIDCARKLINKNICFFLAGDGDLLKNIKIKSTGLPNVVLPGWLEQSEINTLLEYSDVGVCPTTRVRNAFPNKVFVYLSAGLPIMSAWQGDLKRVIEKYQIGFYYPPNDVDALVNSIEKLYEDQELYRTMSNNALSIFSESLNADKIYEEYSEHIENVVKTLIEKVELKCGTER